MNESVQSIDPNLIHQGRELTSGVEFDINEPLSRGEELIRELSDKAHDYACEQNELLGVSYRRTFERKFAELIVHECSKVVIDLQCSPKDHLTPEEAFGEGQKYSARLINNALGIGEHSDFDFT